MIERFFRALRLDSSFYREASMDESLDGESRFWVILVALLSSLGALFGQNGSGWAFLGSLASSILLGWLLWAVVAWFIGRNAMDGEGTLNGMFRVIAYASLPRLLGLLGWMPLIGWLFNLAGWVLGLLAGIIAIREGMLVDTGKAVIIALLGALLFIAASMLIGVLTMPFKLVF